MDKNTNLNLIKQPKKVETNHILKEIDDFQGGEEITSTRQDLSERDQSNSSEDIHLSEQETWSAKNSTSKFTAKKYERKITRNIFWSILTYTDGRKLNYRGPN
ncbi:hypothetical protein PanWU01x14_013270 [Parasponia andersonii]|uniref:Uncharacterized protein n=1 Tax=Parasponia andersonii TaxID=3476 RepID=A0A2P5E0Z8_PARAD|nr:hypothetical protein PanWU01x14_013270 [Parasponia andersonii]